MNVQRAMTKFRGFSDMRKLLCEVIGFTLMPDQILELRKEFEKLDVHQTGEISLDGLKQVLCKKSNDHINTQRHVSSKRVRGGGCNGIFAPVGEQ